MIAVLLLPSVLFSQPLVAQFEPPLRNRMDEFRNQQNQPVQPQEEFQPRQLPGRTRPDPLPPSFDSRQSPDRQNTDVTRYVRLEIFTTARASTTALQEWAEILSTVGADNVRVQSSGGVVEPRVEESRYGSTANINVIAVVNDRQIQLPGARFGRNDVAGIRDYIQKLKDDGSDVALAEKKAFGLTSEQLVDVHNQLKMPLEFSTRGLRIAALIEAVSTASGIQFQLDRNAQAALAGGATIPEELNGMSTGTSLAAALRPLGLSLAPGREQGGQVEIRIVDSQSVEDSWPIGWPIERPVNVIEPKMMDRIENFEIRGVALKPVMDALEQRVGIPFLYDHNGMARAGIDLNTQTVTLVKQSVAHATAMSQLLGQSTPQMRHELRIDENGKPFVWISTLR